MTQPSMQGNVAPPSLRQQREAQYGASWDWQSKLMQEIWPNMSQLVAAGYYHPWYMIFTKLMRLLKSPRRMDSWADIIGYAQLVIDDLQEKEDER